MMRGYGAILLGVAALALLGTGPTVTAETAIVCAKDASFAENLAAREVRRYVYVRTGVLLDVVAALPEQGDAVVVAAAGGPLAEGIVMGAPLGPQEYAVKTVAKGGRRIVYIVGAGESVLYGAYRFAEQLGVRFYLHGDGVPDARIPLAFPDLDLREAPLFDLRGIQPFHDFPEGPDWWNPEDYLAIIAQLPKLRMNFFGLHTYPENRPNAEPTTWIGQPKDINGDGTVQFGYPAIYYNTALPVNWGLAPRDTSTYALGAGMLYDRDAYGSEIMRGLTPMPQSPEDCVAVFDRAGAMFRDAFGLARQLGVKTCLGTETPLTVPQCVAERLMEGKMPLFKPVGGKTPSFVAAIEDTEDDILYQSVRYDMKGYTVAVPNGTYTVKLQFCEPAHGAAGGRVFGVSLEGNKVIPSLDVFAKVGMNRALDYTFDNIAVSDGELNIDFEYQTEYPCIAAFAVTGPEFACKVNCGGPVYKDYAADSSALPVGPEGIRTLYEGIFQRIAKTHPLDFYWFWTPESWTWNSISEAEVKAAMDDIQTALAAAKAVNVPFKLATCGWVLGPQNDRSLFDKVLPKDMPVSCINRAVGHDPVEPGFAEVQGRGKWAIPWLEDDPALTSPQLWVERMRRDAYDARKYGCTGLMGIHWRTRILGPNVAALARAAWNQTWAEQPKPETGWPTDDFWGDWALNEFGPEAAVETAAIFGRIDGKLPRPSDWIGGPGGYKPDDRPWAEVEKLYEYVDDLAAVRPRVQGAGNLARFDYWLANFRFMRDTAKMQCVWARYNKAIEKVKQVQDAAQQRELARTEALPVRRELVAVVNAAMRNLLATVTTSGAMGTVTNLEQHTVPGMIDAPGEELAKLLGEPLPTDAQLATAYDGPPRLFVPTVRGSLRPGEALQLKAIVLAAAAPRDVTVPWRAMGTGDYTKAAMQHVARGLYAVTLPVSGDIEYYVQATTAEGDVLVWPATAPELNQTVIVMPE